MKLIDAANELATAAIEVEECWERYGKDLELGRWVKALARLVNARECYVATRTAIETRIHAEHSA